MLFQWLHVSNLSIKFSLSWVFKSTASQRNVRRGVHTQYIVCNLQDKVITTVWNFIVDSCCGYILTNLINESSLSCYSIMSVWKYTSACKRIHRRVLRWILIGRCVRFISVLPALDSRGDTLRKLLFQVLQMLLVLCWLRKVYTPDHTPTVWSHIWWVCFMW
jgi:hypothetical protein